MSASNALILYRFSAHNSGTMAGKVLKHFAGRLRALGNLFRIPIRFVLIADNTPDNAGLDAENTVRSAMSQYPEFEFERVHTQLLPNNTRLMPDGTQSQKWQPKHFTHFVTSMQKALQWADDGSAVFFCEDDYLYHETALPKAFQMVLKFRGDFVSLYDGPSHYGPHLSVEALRADRPGYDLELVREFDHHWRTGDSACFTYVATMEALKRQGNFFLGMEGDWGDCGLWKGMWQNRKSKLWSSVPALVFHNNSLNFDTQYWRDLMSEVLRG
jgi:hypothetical protein